MEYKKEDLSNYTQVMYSISKETIINKDITKVNELLKELRKDVKTNCNKLIMLFDGYDYDNREIYEIEEIREFVKKVFAENEDLFYFVSPLNHNCNIILACISDFEQIKVKGSIRVLVKNNPNIILRNKIINGISKCCNGNIDMIKKISKQLFVE